MLSPEEYVETITEEPPDLAPGDVWRDAQSVYWHDPIHMVPPSVSGVMPCCQQTPFDVPQTDRITMNPNEVTCKISPVE